LSQILFTRRGLGQARQLAKAPNICPEAGVDLLLPLLVNENSRIGVPDAPLNLVNAVAEMWRNGFASTFQVGRIGMQPAQQILLTPDVTAEDLDYHIDGCDPAITCRHHIVDGSKGLQQDAIGNRLLLLGVVNSVACLLDCRIALDFFRRLGRIRRPDHDAAVVYFRITTPHLGWGQAVGVMHGSRLIDPSVQTTLGARCQKRQAEQSTPKAPQTSAH
jgi:hypothetical protein